MADDVVYLEHPVSDEEKAKHKGKRIIDARFRPEDDKPAKKPAKKAD